MGVARGGRGHGLCRSSSGRDGRGSMGGVCGFRGDVGGALAWPDDGRNNGKQWFLADVVGATSPPPLRRDSARRGHGMGGGWVR
jgi:hypothetical protein